MTKQISPGDRVRFAPNPRFPHKLVEATVIRLREVSRYRQGWADTRDDAGFERSVRPSRCTIVAKPDPLQSETLPPAIDGCTCICHTQPGVRHFMACCGEASPIQRVQATDRKGS